MAYMFKGKGTLNTSAPCTCCRTRASTMTSSSAPPMSNQSAKVVKTVFFALILDLLGKLTLQTLFLRSPDLKVFVLVLNRNLQRSFIAFTIPLPLFPRLIDYYTSQETSDPNSSLSLTLSTFRSLRAFATRHASGSKTSVLEQGNKRWDVVLLGGALGSIFSLCQCIISPSLGSCEFRYQGGHCEESRLISLIGCLLVSDKYGRKPVLLMTMIGNLISAFIWLKSTTFVSIFHPDEQILVVDLTQRCEYCILVVHVSDLSSRRRS